MTLPPKTPLEATFKILYRPSVVFRTVRRLLASVGLACLAAALPSRPASADALRVHVADGACPSTELLRQKLVPLFPDAELAFDANLPATSGAREATVRDLGTRYAVELPGLTRQLEIQRATALERARVAAV